MENQIFRGQVGQATAGDIVNFNFGTPSAGHDDGGSMVPAQRKALHDLVRTITDEFDDEAWEVWRIVHAKLGVTTVHELTRSQFEPAAAVLREHLTFRREESLMRGLVAKILRVTAEKDNRAEVEFFCSRNYGTSQFKLLTREQLQSTLGFAHDWYPPKVAVSTPSAASEPAGSPACSSASGVVASPALHTSATDRAIWKWIIGAFILGFAMGRFF